ncbi:MAG: hypothetical protein R3F21_03700 [Myxococcota bacterium]
MPNVQRFSDPKLRAAGGRSGSSARPIVLLGLLVLLALSSACAGGPPLAVKPGPYEPLAKDEGFLVVQVDTDLALERIDAGSRSIVRNLQPGRHLWLVRMKAGKMRWTAVEIVALASKDKSVELESKGVLNEREFEFDVVAGALNYPGEIVVRMYTPEWGAGAGVSIRNRNHSAMAIRRLSKSHPELVAAHPIRYAGSSGDEFLQFYTQKRSRVRGDAPIETGGSK